MIPSKVLFPLECGFIDMYPGATSAKGRNVAVCLTNTYNRGLGPKSLFNPLNKSSVLLYLINITWFIAES